MTKQISRKSQDSPNTPVCRHSATPPRGNATLNVSPDTFNVALGACVSGGRRRCSKRVSLAGQSRGSGGIARGGGGGLRVRGFRRLRVGRCDRDMARPSAEDRPRSRERGLRIRRVPQGSRTREKSFVPPRDVAPPRNGNAPTTKQISRKSQDSPPRQSAATRQPNPAATRH